jgi:hypothetical protein
MNAHTARSIIFVAALVSLQACNPTEYSTQPTTVVPTAGGYYDAVTSSFRAAPARQNRRPSWIQPGASQGTLLYVSSEMSDAVNIYSFPQVKLVGQITGSWFPPLGICSDTKGDVFVPDEAAHNILEFAHGGTTSIATLEDPNENPFSCSVDPKSGTLAVTNITNSNNTAGDVVLYTNASGSPTAVFDPDIALYYQSGYDNKGNLFVDGYSSFPSRAGVFGFAELPKGRDKLKTIKIDKNINAPGMIQWDGAYMAIGDAQNGHVYRTDGETGKVLSTVTLKGAQNDYEGAIEGSTIVMPVFYSIYTGFWKYPGGGTSQRHIRIGSAFGATFSVAPNRKEATK